MTCRFVSHTFIKPIVEQWVAHFAVGTVKRISHISDNGIDQINDDDSDKIPDGFIKVDANRIIDVKKDSNVSSL